MSTEPSLPLTSIKKTASKRRKDDICPICLDIHGNRKIKMLAKCKHEFHTLCINKWIRNDTNTTCPVCRESIFEDHRDDFITSYPSLLTETVPNIRDAFDIYNLHIIEGYNVPYQTYNVALTVMLSM